MSAENPVNLITTAEALAAASTQLASKSWLAIDTEFLRERTYRPELCLIQVATDEHLFCIDPLALDNIDCLLDVIYNKDITKVLHAAGQDLEILYWLRGSVPENLFDTQIAAPLLGYPEQAGYATLVQQVLDVELSKSHSRADWARRPLPAQQLAYAADDVIYLSRMYPVFIRELESLGRRDWLEGEWQALTNPELYEKPVDQMWKKLRHIDKLKGARLSVAQHLAKWREETARARNLPRNWLLKDDVLVSIAKQLPEDVKNLKHIRGISEGFLRHHADSIVSIVSTARDSQPAHMITPRRKAKLTQLQDAAIDVLTAVAKSHADDLRINASVLAPRKSLEDLVRGQTDTAVMRGWRAELIGTPLQEVLNGTRTLSFNDGVLAISESQSPI